MPATRQPRTGDTYIFKVGKLHYVMQFINVAHEPDHNVPQFRFRAQVAVFENGYKVVPKRPNLKRIYRIKTRPKGQLLFVMLSGTEPKLPRHIRYWGHIEPTGPWIPEIELCQQMPVEEREVDGITITPQVARFTYVRDRIADDQRRAESVAVDPQFFPHWLETVEGSVIVRAEKLVSDFQGRIEKGTSAKTALKTCVKAVNSLDAKHRFIGTIEAEELIEVLLEVAADGGLESAKAEALIDQFRDW